MQVARIKDLLPGDVFVPAGGVAVFRYSGHANESGLICWYRSNASESNKYEVYFPENSMLFATIIYNTKNITMKCISTSKVYGIQIEDAVPSQGIILMRKKSANSEKLIDAHNSGFIVTRDNDKDSKVKETCIHWPDGTFSGFYAGSNAIENVKMIFENFKHSFDFFQV